MNACGSINSVLIFQRFLRLVVLLAMGSGERSCLVSVCVGVVLVSWQLLLSVVLHARACCRRCVLSAPRGVPCGHVSPPRDLASRRHVLLRTIDKKESNKNISEGEE